MSTSFMWAALITLGIAAPIVVFIYQSFGAKAARPVVMGVISGLLIVGLLVDHEGDLKREAKVAWERENQLLIAECVQRTAARWSDCAQSEWVLRGGQ